MRSKLEIEGERLGSWGLFSDGTAVLHARAQASLATVHNLWIAVAIGAVLTAFLWCNAPLLIQGAALPCRPERSCRALLARSAASGHTPM